MAGNGTAADTEVAAALQPARLETPAQDKQGKLVSTGSWPPSGGKHRGMQAQAQQKQQHAVQEQHDLRTVVVQGKGGRFAPALSGASEQPACEQQKGGGAAASAHSSPAAAPHYMDGMLGSTWQNLSSMTRSSSGPKLHRASGACSSNSGGKGEQQKDVLQTAKLPPYQRTSTRGSSSSKGSVKWKPGVGEGSAASKPGVGYVSMHSTLSLSDEESKQSVGTEGRANVGGMPFSTAIDVWAVGVLCYLLLVGRHPFKRGSMSEVRLASVAARVWSGATLAVVA